MGFGTLVTNIIMFIAVISLATGFIAIFKMYVDESSSAMKIQSDAITNNMKTDITIQTASYDNDTETLSAYVLNTGKVKLDVDNVDLFVDDLFIPRISANRTISVQNTTEIENPGIWDPKEVLEVRIGINISRGSHTLKVATQYGVVDSYLFSY